MLLQSAAIAPVFQRGSHFRAQRNISRGKQISAASVMESVLKPLMDGEIKKRRGAE
jgi:hypothetical protein